MDMGKMVGIIITITVAIIIFVAVLVPVISDATADGGPLDGNATWITLVTVCGTLTIIAILMVVVRALGKSERAKPELPAAAGEDKIRRHHIEGMRTWKNSSSSQSRSTWCCWP